MPPQSGGTELGMTDKSYKNIKRFYMLLSASAALGAIAGALYYVNFGAFSDNVAEHIKSFIQAIDSDINYRGIVISAIKDSLILTAVFILCSFARPGVVLIAAIAARKGFIYAFTNAAFVGVYGTVGVLYVVSRLPELFLMLSAMFMLGAVCCARAAGFEERNKKSLKFIIFFFLASASIFCAASAAEGFLTTTFMKIISFWVT